MKRHCRKRAALLAGSLAASLCLTGCSAAMQMIADAAGPMPAFAETGGTHAQGIAVAAGRKGHGKARPREGEP